MEKRIHFSVSIKTVVSPTKPGERVSKPTVHKLLGTILPRRRTIYLQSSELAEVFLTLHYS